jgi:hypothetical protein
LSGNVFCFTTEGTAWVHGQHVKCTTAGKIAADLGIPAGQRPAVICTAVIHSLLLKASGLVSTASLASRLAPSAKPKTAWASKNGKPIADKPHRLDRRWLRDSWPLAVA